MTGRAPACTAHWLFPGSHVCAFYRGDTDRDRLLSGYRRGEPLPGATGVCVVDTADTAEAAGSPVFNLALLFDNEFKNYKESKKYYLMAVEKGDASAMYNLALLFKERI